MASDLDADLVLHVWPANWGLPTIFPDCLAAVLYAQLTIPGKFVVEECTNPDLSPDGQLPYLTDGLACVASLFSIVKYISGIRRRRAEDDEEADNDDKLDLTDLSAPLSLEERAKETAWTALVSAHLGDLVACSYFALRHNYNECMRLSLAQVLPVPQRYYVPDRIRRSYRPRLDAAGLWTVHAEEVEEERRRRGGLAAQAVVTDAFWREKVVEKADASLRLLADLLGDKQFFFRDHPTTLDVYVASHILLLTTPALPNDLLRTLVSSSYPSLHAHAQRIKTRTIPSESLTLEASLSLSHSFDLAETQSRATISAPPIRIRSASPRTFSQVFRSLSPPSWRQIRSRHTGKTDEEKAEDLWFDGMRWMWFAVAAGALVWAASGFQLVIVPEEELEEMKASAGDSRSEMEKEEDEEEDEGDGNGDEEESADDDLSDQFWADDDSS